MIKKREIREHISNIFNKGSFVQNVSIVFSGNVLHFLIQFAVTPIISRLFGPEAYGEYSYYNLIITNILFIGGLSLPEVYLIPKERYKFLALGKFVVCSVGLITFLTLILYFFLQQGDKLQIPILFLIIIVLRLLIGPINAVLGSMNTRRKRFKKNVLVHISGTVLSKGSVILSGLLGYVSGLGLLLGDMLRTLYNLLVQVELKNMLLFKRYLFGDNWSEVKNVIKEYRGVITYLFPTQMLNKWTSDFVILGIGLAFSNEMLGVYVFSITILNIPTMLIENSLKPVMFQKAVEVYQKDPKQLGKYFVKSLQVIPFLSGSLLFFLAAFSNIIFPLVFGVQWIEAGHIVPLLSIQFFASALITPYESFWRILKKEKTLLQNNFISLVLRFSPLLLLILPATDYSFFIVAIAIGSGAGYLILLSNLSAILLGSYKRNVILATALITLTVIYLLVNLISTNISL